VYEIQIHHVHGEGLKKNGHKDWPTGRGPEDWVDLEHMRLYCEPHHKIIDAEEAEMLKNERRINYT
jgi:hypothetical protein